MPKSKIRKYGNRNYWKVQDEWAGDAVLNLLGRISLIERYPNDNIECLNIRLEYFKSNEFLEEFCVKHKLGFRADDLERSLYYLILKNFGAARAMASEMVEYFDRSLYLRRMLNEHKQSRSQQYQSRHDLNFVPVDCPVCQTNVFKVKNYNEQHYGVMCAFCHKESFGASKRQAFEEWNKINAGLVKVDEVLIK